MPSSDHLDVALARLEWFLPAVLREVHVQWRHESLDGLLPYVARKTGENEAEIIGHCILISDQTTTPLHLRLQLAQDADEISWLELRLGEQGESGMVRAPYPTLRMKKVAALKDGIDSIEWVYKVTFGDKRP